VPAGLARDFQAAVGAKQKALDAFLNDRCAEIEADLRGHAAAYLSAAFALGFEARGARVDARAAADKLKPGRLRGFAFRWKAALDATRDTPDPVFAPWHAFAALPAPEFSRKAPGVARSLAEADDPKVCNPVLAAAFAENAPATMGDVAARYGSILAEVARRWDEARKADPNAKGLADPAWESLRHGFYGEGGPLSLSADALPRMLDRAERNRYNALNSEVAKVKATHPGSPPRAMALNDAPRPVEPHVFLRGNPGRPGKAVPRRFLAVLSGPDRQPFRDGSGRRELADAIASADNPLTARVLVNRVWLHHFGTGLVSSPSDFGRRSYPPSHPELLDWLATDFIRNGWSIKHLHRRMMLSHAYRQRSEPRSECLAVDPENRLYWKFNRRRLELEALRDAVLAVSGALDPAMDGRPVPLFEPPFPPRRTVYGFIDRQNLEGSYRTFDFASPDSSSPRRFVTTVPQQALFLLNSPFALDQSRRLAALAEGQGSPEARVRWLYQRLFGREPDGREVALGVAFVRRQQAGGTADKLSPWGEYAQVLLLTNEFVFVD
jgi:hypothetical protein